MVVAVAPPCSHCIYPPFPFPLPYPCTSAQPRPHLPSHSFVTFRDILAYFAVKYAALWAPRTAQCKFPPKLGSIRVHAPWCTRNHRYTRLSYKLSCSYHPHLRIAMFSLTCFHLWLRRLKPAQAENARPSGDQGRNIETKAQMARPKRGRDGASKHGGEAMAALTLPRGETSASRQALVVICVYKYAHPFYSKENDVTRSFW